jgi:hypothetical protein
MWNYNQCHFLNFSFSFIYLLTCVNVDWATNPLPSTPVLPGRTYLFHPLILQFCLRENIRNKKDVAFLLLWGKDSNMERFLEMFPCTCVLQSTLVHLCQISSLLPGPLPIVASASLRLFSLYSEHISHIPVSGFLPFLLLLWMFSA